MTKFMEKKNTPLDVQMNVKKYLNYNHNTAENKETLIIFYENQVKIY